MTSAKLISDLLKRGQAVAAENMPKVLTGAGVAGTVATAVLTGRASFKAARIIHSEALQRTPSDDDKKIGNDFAGLPNLDLSEKVKLVWTEYIPAVGVGGLTIASIIMSNRISAKEAAALATAYGLSERAFSEYKEKVVEKFGPNKETAVRDEVAQDRVNANPVTGRDVIITGSGEVLCYDVLTDRYYTSTVEEIKRAENTVNFEIVNHDAVPLSRFYDEIGLTVTPYSDTVGWNIDNRCEVQLSAVLSKDNRPCMSVDFARWPKPNFEKSWS